MRGAESTPDSSPSGGASLGLVRRKTFGRVRRLMAAGDLLAILGAALALEFGLLPLVGRAVDLGQVGPVFLILLPVWVPIAFWLGLYHDFERRLDRSIVHEVGRIAVAAALWDWLFIFLRAALTDGITELLPMALLWVLMVPSILLLRSGVRIVARRAGWDRQRVAVLGDAQGVAKVAERVARHPEWGIDLVLEIPVYSPGEAGDGKASSDRGELGPDRVVSLLASSGVARLMISGGHAGFETLDDRTALVQAVVERGISVDIVTGGPESLYTRALNQDMEGLPLVSVAPAFPPPFSLALKRGFDLAGSVVGLVAFSPIMLWAAARVRFGSPGPIIYRSRRVGRDDREFLALKFRTMVEDADAQRPALREQLDREGGDVLFKLEDDPRVTRVGRTLRTWSIDELPQLWNVLKGEMSLVGPRPLPPEEAERAEALFAARTRMRPGLAGPWQALGRSSIPFDDMVRLDYSYVTGWSLSGDLVLLLRTASAVVRRHGAL